MTRRWKHTEPPSHQAWKASLPAEIAARQARYERAAIIYRARRAGFTYREIGDRVGLSLERARQIYTWFVRCYVMRPNRSPIESYCAPYVDFDFLVGVLDDHNAQRAMAQRPLFDSPHPKEKTHG